MWASKKQSSLLKYLHFVLRFNVSCLRITYGRCWPYTDNTVTEGDLKELNINSDKQD